MISSALDVNSRRAVEPWRGRRQLRAAKYQYAPRQIIRHVTLVSVDAIYRLNSYQEGQRLPRDNARRFRLGASAEPATRYWRGDFSREFHARWTEPAVGCLLRSGRCHCFK